MNPHDFIFQGKIPAPQGTETVPQSTGRCTRCGACAQSCPAYRLTGEEIFSPRGRIQLLRLLSQGKLKITPHRKQLQEVVRTCIFCARCTQACAGQIALPHQMIALRRALKLETLPYSLHTFLRWQATHPVLFDKLMRGFLFLRRIKLSAVYWLFPAWVRRLERCCTPKAVALETLLEKEKITRTPPDPDCLYLPSFEARYLDPQIAFYILRLVAPRKVRIWQGPDTGLFEYMYGDLALCLKQARRFIRQWEQLDPKTPLPLLVDSAEMYGFLKHYPHLFESWPAWHKRAKRLAQKVKFITDFWPRKKPAKAPDKPFSALDQSSALFPAGELTAAAHQKLHTLLGKNLLECEYSPFPVPAFALYLAGTEQVNKILFQKVQYTARIPLRRIYTLSGWVALELSAALQQQKSSVQVRHIAYAEAAYERFSAPSTASVSRREVKSSR